MSDLILYKYTLLNSVNNLDRNDKIYVLSQVLKTNKECVFESGEGTTIRLDPLSDELITHLYNYVIKRV